MATLRPLSPSSLGAHVAISAVGTVRFVGDKTKQPHLTRLKDLKVASPLGSSGGRKNQKIILNMNVHRSSPKSLVSICFVALYAALALGFDSAKSGNYLIVYCDADTAGSHAAYLQKLIPYMQSHLEAVVTDLDRGTASPAFRAFFKTNNNLEPVRKVFTDIINGSKIVTGQNGRFKPPPTLVCADTDEPSLDHLMDACNSYTRPGAYIVNPQKLVALCRIFWTEPPAARKTACPQIANGKALTEPTSLVETQYSILVHELVHIYNMFDDSWQEVYGFDDVVGLDAIRSVENAQNYAIYAAGQLRLLSSAMPYFVKENRADEVRRSSYSSGLYRISFSTGFRRRYVFVHDLIFHSKSLTITRR